MHEFVVRKDSSQGSLLIPIESELLEKRIIFLTGEISRDSALDFLKKLTYLASKNNCKGEDGVILVIDSPGGEISAGLSIIGAIKNAPFKVNSFCMSECASMGAVIFSSATGWRKMSPYSRLMFHEPLISKTDASSLSEVKESVKKLTEKKNILSMILRERTGKKNIGRILGKDRYFLVKEASEYNLCDGEGSLKEVIDFAKKEDILWN